MVLLAMSTGMRRGGSFNLSRDWVDLERAVLTVKGKTAKSGTTRHIPVNDELLCVLKAWRDESLSCALVFPVPKGKSAKVTKGVKEEIPFDNISASWEGLLKPAQIRRFRWHDLRLHFASRLVMAGVDLNTIRELLGHADIRMTLRYAYRKAVLLAAQETGIPKGHFPAECPCSAEQVMNGEFWPE